MSTPETPDRDPNTNADLARSNVADAFEDQPQAGAEPQGVEPQSQHGEGSTTPAEPQPESGAPGQTADTEKALGAALNQAVLQQRPGTNQSAEPKSPTIDARVRAREQRYY